MSPVSECVRTQHFNRAFQHKCKRQKDAEKNCLIHEWNWRSDLRLFEGSKIFIMNDNELNSGPSTCINYIGKIYSLILSELDCGGALTQNKLVYLTNWSKIEVRRIKTEQECMLNSWICSDCSLAFFPSVSSLLHIKSHSNDSQREHFGILLWSKHWVGIHPTCWFVIVGTKLV